MATLRLILLFLLLPASLWSNPLLAQSLRCDDAVALRTGRITVAANGVDDTQNIQCALNEAKRLRIPVVRLTDEAYYISSIQIEDFKGALEGHGRDETTVVVLNDSINCEGMVENEQAPAAFKFIKGDVELRWMTIGASTPCIGSDSYLTLVHFTGPNSHSGNGFTTGFGTVNRVNLISLGSQSSQNYQYNSGVGAFPEWNVWFAHQQVTTGALRLERSFLAGFYQAVVVQLRASASIDIAFNEFVDNIYGVFSLGANQRLSVQSNTLVTTDQLAWSGAAVWVGDGSYQIWPAKQDRAVIYRNTFSLETASDAVYTNSVSNRSVEISANNFGIKSGENAVTLSSFHGANVTSNLFEGSGQTAVLLTAYGSRKSDENNITGNDFSGFCASRADVFLEEELSGNIVGPGQNALVEDLGSGNYVLDEFETPIKTDCDISAIWQSDQVLSAKARYLELRSRIMGLLESREGP